MYLSNHWREKNKQNIWDSVPENDEIARMGTTLMCK